MRRLETNMVIEQQLYSVDDVWDLAHQAENENIHYELIDGELFTMSPPGYAHGRLAVLIAHYILNFTQAQKLGEVTVESGYHPPDSRHTLLSPNVAFLSKAKAPQPFWGKYIPVMPDLAVEILSPTDTLRQVRRKAALYLRHGTQLVWIVLPAEKGVDVCRSVDGARLDIEFVSSEGNLSGEQILPGFALQVGLLFPAKSDSETK